MRAVKCSPFFAHAGARIFPFPGAQRGFDGLQRHAGFDIFRNVQKGRVGLADYFFGLVPIKTARALVPREDLAFEVCADD